MLFNLLLKTLNYIVMFKNREIKYNVVSSVFFLFFLNAPRAAVVHI